MMSEKGNRYFKLLKGSLKYKMISSFIIIIILMSILNIVPFVVTKQTIDKMDKMAETTVLANEIVTLTNNIRDTSEQYMTDKKEKQKISILDNLSKINEDLKTLKVNVQNKSSKTSLDTIERIINTYDEQITKIIEKNNTKGYSEAMDNKEKAIQTMWILKEGVDEFISSELSYYKDLKIDRDRKNNETRTGIIVLIFIIAALSVVGSIIFSQRIANTIFNLVSAAKEIADGNLQCKEIKINSRDEIFMLAKAFNKMSENLRQIIGSMAESSNNVINSTNILEANVKQNMRSVEQITTTIEQVSGGAAEQSNRCEEIVKAVNELYARNIKINESINKALQTSQAASKAAENGNDKINVLIKQINIIERKILQTNGITGVLETRMNEIKNILDAINSISEQTNLLALNAAIEAARAGEYGKGFAVVADEIRKLSEKTSHSTKEITEMLKDIQNQSSQVSASMYEGVEEVKEGTKLAEVAKASFKEIVLTSDNVDNEIKQINFEVNKIVEEIKRVENMSKDIYSVSEETSVGSNEVVALIEEQTSSLEEISSLVETLKNMAGQLKIIVNEFKM